MGLFKKNSSKKSAKNKVIDVLTPKKHEEVIEILPVLVDRFDELLQDEGLERGSTTIITGGAGTGKTTFCMQSLYHGALAGDKGVYISFEEDTTKIKHHMLKNFGWDVEKLEKKGMMAVIKVDPSKTARMVEGTLAKEVGALRIELSKMKLPLKPDRIAVDSLSALSIAFENERSYRKYVRELFEMLESYNSVNLVIGETEQNPDVYSRTGVEEFLADGVVVLYNIKHKGRRKNALEILKMRSGGHIKQMVGYRLTGKGWQVQVEEEWEEVLRGAPPKPAKAKRIQLRKMKIK
ncbi:MAG: gas vesicle protein GvpD [archaeon]|nr:gas vesicle protein GvpD [archaeon]